MPVEPVAGPHTAPAMLRDCLPMLQQTDFALNHDFCPWANRWVYWMKRPLVAMLLATGLSLVCGIFLQTEALVIAAILLLIVGVGVSFPWLAMRGIDVHLKFDVRRSRTGHPVLVRLRVRNRWPWPVWGLSVLRGFAVREATDTEEGVSLACVHGWSTAEYSWPFVPQIRGRYPLTAPEVETGFPFGLYRATRNATVDGHLVVWPKTVILSGLPDAAETRQSDEQLADRRVGDFGDKLGTRLFRHGDSLRRVHWAQTARQQQLIVCERQAPATTAVRVTLDLDRASHPNCNSAEHHRDDTVEQAVQVAASVCESLHRQHCRIELVLHDQLLVAGESATGFYRLMDCLAQATLADSTSTLNRRRAAADFGIAVTTSAGLRWRGRQLSGQHVICLSDGNMDQQSAPTHDAWISLVGSSDIEEVLPRRWKGACNVR